VRTLDVRTLSGSIRVTGDNGVDVRLDAVTRVEADDDATVRAGLQAAKLEADAQGATVAITLRDDGQNTCGEQEWHRGPAWWDRRRFSSSTELTIQVPRDVRVRLCTVNGDTVSVTGVTGDFDVSNVNGKVVLSGMAGSGSATTVNGGIEASFASSPRSESRFKTVNGTIAATFPRDLAADLQLKTFNGGLFTDFEVEPLQQPINVSMRRQNGKYVYRSSAFTAVRAGGGGPELTLQTMNGDVRVLRRSH